MFKHILVPTDGSERSESAVERVCQLARLCGAKVTGIHVMPDKRMQIVGADVWPAATDESINHQNLERAERYLAFVQSTAKAAGVSCETLVVNELYATYDAIVKAANERGCDLIVMTACDRGGGVSRVIGGEATRVLRRASIPVLTLRS